MAELFDYDYTNIYRDNQDLDLVVTRADGRAESDQEIRGFQKVIEERFPYVEGNKKSEWEVRGLKAGHGAKMPLLEDFDFKNQHMDSNSVGLIELTEPVDKEPVVRDLRNWGNGACPFLEDVARSALTCYFSSTHENTLRAQEGKNPSIISAVRYLTKVFQHEQNMDRESLEKIKEVIDGFDPHKLVPHITKSYVLDWIERNGKKLIKNASDIEYAWNVLEDLGLRKKLIALGDPKVKGSLSELLNREPLRSHDHPKKRKIDWVREKEGQTAEELGITVVAHETTDYEVYEAIMRSKNRKFWLYTLQIPHLG